MIFFFLNYIYTYTCKLISKATRWVCEIPCFWWGGQGHRVKVTKKSTLMSSVQPKENTYYRYDDSSIYRSRVTDKREVCRKVYLRTNKKTDRWIKLNWHALNHLIWGRGVGRINRFHLLNYSAAFGAHFSFPPKSVIIG